ncbi:MAG: prepilin-type N-terminal cleavage/methylation domain-containing protein [Parcubacteria group bacterium]|nr:prepilin-type N-terminal cleavage/methylation domain-containing protein [Parcubacteria group bacterium]
MNNLSPKTYHLKPSDGFTLLEAIVYIAILSLMFVVITHTAIVATAAFGKSRVKSALAAEGFVAMDRILREIRLAHGIDGEASVFGAHPGVLKLKTRVSAADATETTRTFALSSGRLYIEEASGETAPLSGGGIEISELTFVLIGTPDSPRAVRVMLVGESAYKALRDTRKFYGTAVLRGRY